MIFDDLYLDDVLLQAVSKQGFTTPTAVQENAIPAILAGKDVLACAATGTGKTAAFVLPALQRLLDTPSGTQYSRILMLAPTRELAFQIHHVVSQFSEGLDLNIAIITGGFSQGKQQQILQQHFDVIIATPGRLLNLVSEESVDLSNLELVIIDEADRMLDMGQGPDVLALLATIEQGFQTCLFSATLAGSGVEIFAQELLKDAQHIEIHAANKQSQQVEQRVYFADDKQHKQALLIAIINDPDCRSALVFCNKRDRAEEVSHYLQSCNISAQVMHGDFKQADRRERVKKFRTGKIKVMVATDVAARGLDLTSITHVINYDMPLRGDIYIHRTGRTGRALQTGVAVNLVEQHDLKNLERVEFHLKTKLPRLKWPGLEPKTSIAKKDKKKARADKTRYVAKKDRANAEES